MVHVVFRIANIAIKKGWNRNACVAAVWSAGKWPDDIGSGYQDMIRRVLKLKGISEEQFQQDIAALDADYSPSVAEKEEGTDNGSGTSEHS